MALAHWVNNHWHDTHWADNHWVEGAAVKPPVVRARGGAHHLRYGLTAEWVEEPDELTATLDVRITARVAWRTPEPICAATLDVRITAEADLEAPIGHLTGRGYVANPGHRIVVVEAAPEEGDALVLVR